MDFWLDRKKDGNMKITVVLHSILRDKLPPKARGMAELEFDRGARVQDVLKHLDLPETVIWAINEKMDNNTSRLLQDGDTLRFLRPGAGG